MGDDFPRRDLGLSFGQGLFLRRIIGRLENRHLGNRLVHVLTIAQSREPRNIRQMGGAIEIPYSNILPSRYRWTMLRPIITPLTVASITTAVACALPWIFYGTQVLGLAVVLCLVFYGPFVWAIITAIAVIKHRRRAVWLLLGAPVALFNFYTTLTFNACDPTGLHCL